MQRVGTASENKRKNAVGTQTGTKSTNERVGSLHKSHKKAESLRTDGGF